MKSGSEIDSLKRRLAEAEENLRLIRERKSEFVRETNIPLQLIKDERRLMQKIGAWRARLAQIEQEIETPQVQLAHEQPAPPASPPETQPLSVEVEVGGPKQKGPWTVRVRLWYRSLPLKQQVAIVVALIGLLGTLCGKLGAPVVGELAERLLARPDETEVAVLTPTHTVAPILLTSTSASTPIPPTLTPTAFPTPIPFITSTPNLSLTPTLSLALTEHPPESYVFDFDDGTTQCWNVRTEPSAGSLGDRVTVTGNIGDNTSYALRFDVNLDSTTGYRSQIEYSKFYDCSDDGVIALLNKAVKLRADVFLPQDAPVPTSVEFWVQEGPERNWKPWYASLPVSLERTQWITVEWQADTAGFGLWQFPYQFGIEVKSEGMYYRGPVYFDNITIVYQP
jgi:hypothetical protein